MRTSIRVWTAFAAAAVIFSTLLTCSSSTPKFAFKSAEKRGVIEANGLRFVIMPDATTNLVQVDVHYEVGAAEDPPGKAGLAHFAEHLMFQMRPDGPTTPPIFQTLLELATFVNAFTAADMTHYWTTVRKDNFDAMLRIEAMRMYFAADLPATPELPAFGCSTVPQGEFEREREVVRNEARGGSTDRYLEQVVEGAMFPTGHAYQRAVIGDDVQIAGATLPEACKFMKDYYTPDRATVIIAGGVDFDTAVAGIQKWFGKIPKRKAVARTEVKDFVPSHQKQEIEADVQRPTLWIGWALPPQNTPDGEAARFGIGSAFGRIARKADEYGFAYSVQSRFLGGQLAPIFAVRIELKSLSKVDEALEFAKRAAEQAYRGWDAGTHMELEESKNRAKADLVRNFEALPDRTLQVGFMVQYEKGMEFGSKKMYLFHALDQIEKFDGNRIKRVVKKALEWDKAGIVVVKPNEKGIKGDKRSVVKFQAQADHVVANATVDPNEARKPLRVVAEQTTLAGAERFSMSNGMNVVLLPIHAMPLVTARMVFRNVGDASTPDNPALAAGAGGFLSRVADMDPMRQRDLDVFSRTGIEIQCDSNDDAMACGTSGINIYLDVMVKGFERMVKAGTYSQPSIERWQKRTRESWKLHTTQETNEYVRQVMTALYGHDHAYTKTAILTPDMANKIGSDALSSFRDKHYRAGNATLILVGSFDVAKAKKLVRDTFGDMERGTVGKPVDNKTYARTGPIFVGVKKKKEDQQVTVTIAYPSPAGVDGQEAARRVLAEMLSLRAEDIRFKLGSTYGLRFGRQSKVGPTSYILRGGAVVGGTIDAERAGESLKAIRESIDGLRTGDKDFNEHFVRARRKLITSLMTESTVTGEIAGRLGFIAQYDLKGDYYNTLLQQMAAVSIAQIRALIKTELAPANEIIVALGDKAHLDKTFAGAGITDVKLVEPDYK